MFNFKVLLLTFSLSHLWSTHPLSTLFSLKQEAERKIRRVQKAATGTIDSVIQLNWKNVTKCLLPAASLSNYSE